MERIVKENGKVWLEEVQGNGNHRRLTYMGEDDEQPKPSKARGKKKTEGD